MIPKEAVMFNIRGLRMEIIYMDTDTIIRGQRIDTIILDEVGDAILLSPEQYKQLLNTKDFVPDVEINWEERCKNGSL
jgi:hypothetical protein